MYCFCYLYWEFQKVFLKQTNKGGYVGPSPCRATVQGLQNCPGPVPAGWLLVAVSPRQMPPQSWDRRPGPCRAPRARCVRVHAFLALFLTVPHRKQVGILRGRYAPRASAGGGAGDKGTHYVAPGATIVGRCWCGLQPLPLSAPPVRGAGVPCGRPPHPCFSEMGGLKPGDHTFAPASRSVSKGTRWKHFYPLTWF